MSKKKKHTLLDKLSERFHILIVNEKTLERKKLLSSSSLNLAVSSFIAFLVVLSASFLLIYFTPLKEYFRGYTSLELRQNAVENSMKLDSLESLYITQSNYINSLKDLLSGNISFEELDENLSINENSFNELEIVATNQEDSLLRALVEEEDKYNAFDIQGERFTTTGFVIIIEHLNGLTSIYKHNSSIVKSQGDRVGTGEIIAFTGNTGELTTGPHLHFELWYQGEPVDPQSYIEF